MSQKFLLQKDNCRIGKKLRRQNEMTAFDPLTRLYQGILVLTGIWFHQPKVTQTLE